MVKRHGGVFYMGIIEQEIQKRGKVLPGNVLKVNSFLNHQLDPYLLNIMAGEWTKLFKNDNITKIVTIEASGIALAILTGLKLNVPVVFAKKSNSKNIGDVYKSKIHSYTRDQDFDIQIEKQFIYKDDIVLIIDDFLANGSATLGMIDIINQAGAKLAGVGIAIEKGFQNGGEILRDKGVRVESLAIISSMDEKTGKIIFKHLS